MPREERLEDAVRVRPPPVTSHRDDEPKNRVREIRIVRQGFLVRLRRGSWIALPETDVPEYLVEIGVVVVRLNRLSHQPIGLIVTAFSAADERKFLLRLDVLRVDLECPREVLLGVVEPALVETGDPEKTMGVGVVRVLFDESFETIRRTLAVRRAETGEAVARSDARRLRGGKQSFPIGRSGGIDDHARRST